LVVDDEIEQREISAAILSKLNYTVTTVSSGEDAVEYMKENYADLLILDMIMKPGIDGLETYRRIIKLHPNQKAIIASGYSESERVKETQKLGAGKYLKKPYTLEKIGIAVKKELLSESCMKFDSNIRND
jgi:DNA-binding NtrC family response regulator